MSASKKQAPLKFPLSLEINSALDSLVSEVRPTLVVVKDGHKRVGAGIIWHSNGLILTNLHVLEGNRPQVLLGDGRQLEAALLSSEPDIDMALLRVPASDLKPIRPGEGLPRVGELVFAFGHPWGQRGMVTSGVVSALITAQTLKLRSLTLLRTDVPLAPGNSGGPLVTARGEMVGINNMIVGGNQSVAIPIGTVKAFVNSYLETMAGRDWDQAAEQDLS